MIDTRKIQKCHNRIFWAGIFFVCISLIIPESVRAAQLDYQSRQTTFFAQQNYTLTFTQGDNFWPNADAFNIRVVYANKTILERNYQAKFPLKIEFQYPHLRPGVVADPMLIIRAYSKGEMLKPVYQQQLFFFSEDYAWAQSLNSIKIGIFDQTENNRLKSFMDSSEIPFTEVYDFSTFDGDWIICSGVDFTQNYSLFTEIQQAFLRGVSILVLPPVQGDLIWPKFQYPVNIVFAHQDRVKIFDKRLDFHAEAANGNEGAVHFQLNTDGNNVFVECLQSGKTGYAWLEFQTPKARMIFLGRDILPLAPSNPSVGLFMEKLILNESNH